AATATASAAAMSSSDRTPDSAAAKAHPASALVIHRGTTAWPRSRVGTFVSTPVSVGSGLQLAQKVGESATGAPGAPQPLHLSPRPVTTTDAMPRRLDEQAACLRYCPGRASVCMTGSRRLRVRPSSRPQDLRARQASVKARITAMIRDALTACIVLLLVGTA